MGVEPTWGFRRDGGSVCETTIDIDQALRRAIMREIGEKLRASFREDPELPETLTRQIDRLRQLENQLPPPTADRRLY
jgi:hypothetical protein